MATHSKKREKEKGPKLYEIIIGAILSVILGVLLAVVYLAFQEVEEVDQLPSEEARQARTVYFVEGETGAPGQFNWRPKQGAFEEGRSGTLELVEQELNQWVADQFSELEDRDYEDEGMFYIAPRTLNFRIDDGKLQLAADLDWTVFGYSHSLKTQALGSFVREEGVFVFEPETMYVGGFKLPEPAVLGSALIRRIVEALNVSADLRDGWASLTDVSIEEDVLILEIP